MSPFNEIIQSVNQFERLHQCFGVLDAAGLSNEEKKKFFLDLDIMILYLRQNDDAGSRSFLEEFSKKDSSLLKVFLGTDVVIWRCLCEGKLIVQVERCYRNMVRDEMTVVTVESLDAYFDWENLDDDDDSDANIPNQEKAPRTRTLKNSAGWLHKAFKGLRRRRRESKARKSTRVHLFRQCEAFVEHGRTQLDNLETERREHEEENSGNSPLGAAHDEAWICKWQARHDEALDRYQSQRNELCRRLDEAKMRHHKKFLFPSSLSDEK